MTAATGVQSVAEQQIIEVIPPLRGGMAITTSRPSPRRRDRRAFRRRERPSPDSSLSARITIWRISGGTHDLPETRGAEARPHRQIGLGRHDREPGFDAFRQREPTADSGGSESDGAAANGHRGTSVARSPRPSPRVPAESSDR